MARLFTIGHSNHSLEHFAGLLRQHGIRRLVDVRSQPYSRRFAHFSRPNLAASLAALGVEYLFRGDSLGGRPAGDRWYGPDGRLDHARRSVALDYLQGIDDVCELAALRPTVVMCAEENPHLCHRRRLLTPSFAERGLDVVHVRGDGTLAAEPADLFGP